MAYVICNDEGQYLHHGDDGREIVSSYDKATKWQKIESANNML